MARLVLVAFLVAACGASRPKIEVPVRADTPGDALIALAPPAADAILEVDMVRLRKNAVMAPLLATMETDQAFSGSDLLRAVDALLICTYGLGDKPRYLFLFSGARAESLAGAQLVTQGIYAVAEPSDLETMRQIANGRGDSLKSDLTFLALRSHAMPKKATGAVLRATARLSFAARIDVARRFDLDAVPSAFSVWADVADDLAIIATLFAKSEAEARNLNRALQNAKDRFARESQALGWLLPQLVKGAEVAVSGKIVQVVIVIGPKRLSRLVKTMIRGLGAES
jgi:hypothetical protein